MSKTWFAFFCMHTRERGLLGAISGGLIAEASRGRRRSRRRRRRSGWCFKPEKLRLKLRTKFALQHFDSWIRVGSELDPTESESAFFVINSNLGVIVKLISSPVRRLNGAAVSCWCFSISRFSSSVQKSKLSTMTILWSCYDLPSTFKCLSASADHRLRKNWRTEWSWHNSLTSKPDFLNERPPYLVEACQTDLVVREIAERPNV